jgi:hypothetical protein
MFGHRSLFAPLRPLWVLSILGLVDCGGEHFEHGVYRSDGVAFQLGPVPEQWRPLEVDGAVLSFRDPTTQAVVSIASRCGKDAEDVPLEALTQHLFIQFTERQVGNQQRVTMDGREALRTEMMAKLDGVNRWFVVYVLKKDGCVYDFWHIAPPPPDEKQLVGFEAAVRGFRTLK